MAINYIILVGFQTFPPSVTLWAHGPMGPMGPWEPWANGTHAIGPMGPMAMALAMALGPCHKGGGNPCNNGGVPRHRNPGDKYIVIKVVVTICNPP